MISRNYYAWNFFEILNFTALSLACAGGFLEIVQLLLEKPGIDINCQNISKLISLLTFHFPSFHKITTRYHLSNRTPFYLIRRLYY